MEGSGCVLVWITVPEFAWRDLKTPRNFQTRCRPSWDINRLTPKYVRWFTAWVSVLGVLVCFSHVHSAELFKFRSKEKPYRWKLSNRWRNKNRNFLCKLALHWEMVVLTAVNVELAFGGRGYEVNVMRCSLVDWYFASCINFYKAARW
jgi:hypothetical protein